MGEKDNVTMAENENVALAENNETMAEKDYGVGYLADEMAKYVNIVFIVFVVVTILAIIWMTCKRFMPREYWQRTFSGRRRSLSIRTHPQKFFSYGKVTNVNI